MKTIGILMTPAMALAVRENRKTETRRLPSKQPDAKWKHLGGFRFCTQDTLLCKTGECGCDVTVKHRYGEAGDELYIKETFWRLGKWVKNGFTKGHVRKGKWRPTMQKWRFKGGSGKLNPNSGDSTYSFAAPESKPKREEVGWHKRPAIFMPRDVARTRLKLLSVGFERLHEITEAGATNEGCEPRVEHCEDCDSDFCELAGGVEDCNGFSVSAKMLYQSLWDSINAARGHGWEKNEWVVVLKFEVVK